MNCQAISTPIVAAREFVKDENPSAMARSNPVANSTQP
jgi:hypothetical protein